MLRSFLRFGTCAALLLTLGIVGCDSADLTPLSADGAATTEPEAAAQAADPDDPRLRAAMRVQNHHTPALMRRAGVLGTATRLNEADEAVIVIYTLSPEHARRADLPARLNDVKVEVRVTGLITAHDANNPQTKERPAPNGFSVGHPDITAGTIGARVKDGNGNVYILSNNHVIANSNDASIGDAILQPGPFDGGTSADQIGTLADFQTISFSSNNVMDAAIALVDGNDLLGATPASAYGAPGTSTRSASLGLGVQKFGRTTGYTTGSIQATNVTISVCYVPRGPFGCASAATFTGQFEVRSGTSNDFSAGGDSGSLIVTNDSQKNPVGLLFAGGGGSTFANPIGPVLSRFNVTIDTESGGGGDPDPGNQAPTASFTYSCSGLTCSFDGSGSSDSDGSIVSYAWTFGDGASGSGVNTSHTYASGDTRSVTLTVTDNEGATGSTSQNVTVSAPSGGITLSASGYKVRGVQHADLSWSGASSSSVDVRRNGSVVATTPNDGSHTDNIGNRGGGSYIYQVCEAGTSTCSNTVNVSF